MSCIGFSQGVMLLLVLWPILTGKGRLLFWSLLTTARGLYLYRFVRPIILSHWPPCCLTFLFLWTACIIISLRLSSFLEALTHFASLISFDFSLLAFHISWLIIHFCKSLSLSLPCPSDISASIYSVSNSLKHYIHWSIIPHLKHTNLINFPVSLTSLYFGENDFNHFLIFLSSLLIYHVPSGGSDRL